MIITINGKEREVPDNLTVSGLVSFLNINSERVAIELNREIAKKSNWDNIYLKNGDILEIVSFVGGG